jgi:hypothetical protein
MSRNRSAKIERPPRLVKQRHESVAVTEAVILLALQAAMTMVGPAPCKPESIWGFVARAWMVSAFVWPDHACRGACTAIGSTYNLRSRGLFRHWKRENTWCGRQGADWCTFMTICTWPTYNKQGALVRWPSFAWACIVAGIPHQAPNHHIPGLVHIQIQSLEISRDPWSDFVCIPYKLKWSQHKVSTKRRGPMALSLRCSANQTNLAIRAPHLFRWSG